MAKDGIYLPDGPRKMSEVASTRDDFDEDDLIDYDIPTACGEESGGGSSTSGMCDDSCTFAEDGECDDGGPDSDTSVCDLGTDCSDCGPR